MGKMDLGKIAWILVLIGALNVGLAAVGFDVLEMVLGGISWLHMLVGILIGLSALMLLFKKK